MSSKLPILSYLIHLELITTIIIISIKFYMKYTTAPQQSELRLDITQNKNKNCPATYYTVIFWAAMKI